MPQTVRPVTDVATSGTWTPSTGSSLSLMLDEPVGTGDTTFVESPANAGPNSATLALGSASTPQAGTVSLRVRHRALVAGGGEQALVAGTDLTLLGQQAAPAQNYANMALAIRYVGSERRFLMYIRDSGQSENAGDLVEYRQNAAGLKNGASHWTVANVPALTEVRRWKVWSTRDRMIAAGAAYGGGTIFRVQGGNGVWPSSFYWDEAHGCLWYTWQPEYPGGSIRWPAYSAVTLSDADAVVVGDAGTTGRTVSNANIHGPFYFKDSTTFDGHKSASAGIIPIPASMQAAMGGAKYLAVGHHSANNGNQGALGVSFWTVGEFPDPVTHPEATPLWPTAVHIYDTSLSSGPAKPNMKKPAVSYQAVGHASQGTVFYKSVGGVISRINAGDPLPLNVGDCLYQHDYGLEDTFTVFMQAGATGGTWVPEIYNGSAWVQPTGWAVSHGSAELSASDNVFYWPSQANAMVTLPGVSTDYWVRLRRTVAGTTGGAVDALILSNQVSDANPYPYRPKGEGVARPLGSELYDASNYAYCYEESYWGGAWVDTPTRTGLAYFGPMLIGGVWYGAAPMYAQPYNGGVPTKVYHASTAGTSYSNGGKTEGGAYPFMWTFDHGQLAECAAGTRPRNTTGLNPVAFTRMFERWPGLIAPLTVPNSDSPYYGRANFSTYGTGHCVVWDPATSQVVVLMSNGAAWNPKPILAFFQVA